MHIEDVKIELKELAILLNSTFEASSENQRNLIIELVSMKLKQIAGE
jgi:hypothetical protein